MLSTLQSIFARDPELTYPPGRYPLFISYSRREAPFVDHLLDHLEDLGFPVWLDYHSLVLAQPWQEQIFAGIDGAEIVLLVVSEAALASKNVESEWRRALAQGKRIILVIFAAVALPPELHTCEWVDFRTSFHHGLRQLVARFDAPAVPTAPPPQAGFRAPWIVWLTFAASLVVTLLSIPTWWSLYPLFILLPLPYRILKRDFNFFEVQSVLITLPVVLFVSGIFLSNQEAILNAITYIFLLSLLPTLLLFFLLRSTGMQRWGKPIASRPRFANPYRPHNPHPEPIPFTVECAPQDRRYAADLIAGLTRYGHPHVEAGDAQVAFVLISPYHSCTALELHRQVVYPVILQDTPAVDRAISRIQWLDFRRGMRDLDNLAQLLPDPARLLKALGIAPMGNQTALPAIIHSLVYFLTFLAVAIVSSWGPFYVQLWPWLGRIEGVWIISLVNAGLIGLSLALIFLTRRALLTRSGRLASLRWVSLVLAGLGLLIFSQWLLGNVMRNDIFNRFGVLGDDDFRDLSAGFGTLVYLAGLIPVVGLALWNRRALWRWFPENNKQ